jgi:hypothetical protein
LVWINRPLDRTALIVDPERQVVIVDPLAGNKYYQPGKCGHGQIASSALLEGFGFDVDAHYAAAENIPE